MELKHIWARVGDREVFRDLSIQTSARHVGVIGPNGAGKSSLLRILQGLVPIQSGRVCLDRPVGMIFQNPDLQILFPTVLEELTFGQTERGVSKSEAEGVAKQTASHYGVSDLVDMATHELSAGQKAMVCLLSVLIDRPKTLLLDESFASLDLMTANRMTKVVQSNGCRVVLSTHQLDLLNDFDEVIWLNQGELKLQGQPKEVLAAYRCWASAQ